MKPFTVALAIVVFAAAAPTSEAQNDRKAGAATPFPTAPDASASTSVPTSGEKMQQLGSQTVDDKTASDVREILARVVNDAVTVNKFGALVQDLAKPDRDRIGAMDGEKFDDLNKAIASFRAEYQARYHHEFELKPEHFKNVTINPGQDKTLLTVSLSDLEKNPAVKPIGTLPLAPSGSGATPHVGAAAGTNGAPPAIVAPDPALSVVAGPAVNLINEGRTAQTIEPALWKVNVPNEITGRQLKGNLAKHLQKLADQKSTWSDDANATARAAATQVFQALNDSSLASEQ